MKSSTETLIKALRILSNDIESPDGVANAPIAEAAERLDELQAQVEVLRLYATELVCSMTEENRQELQDIMMLTPTQYLREIEAKAGRAGFVEASQYNFTVVGQYFIDGHADEYADRIRQGAKP
jgi:hypothetical protein